MNNLQTSPSKPARQLEFNFEQSSFRDKKSFSLVHKLRLHKFVSNYIFDICLDPTANFAEMNSQQARTYIQEKLHKMYLSPSTLNTKLSMGIAQLKIPTFFNSRITRDAVVIAEINEILNKIFEGYEERRKFFNLLQSDNLEPAFAGFEKWYLCNKIKKVNPEKIEFNPLGIALYLEDADYCSICTTSKGITFFGNDLPNYVVGRLVLLKIENYSQTIKPLIKTRVHEFTHVLQKALVPAVQTSSSDDLMNKFRANPKLDIVREHKELCTKQTAYFKQEIINELCAYSAHHAINPNLSALAIDFAALNELENLHNILVDIQDPNTRRAIIQNSKSHIKETFEYAAQFFYLVKEFTKSHPEAWGVLSELSASNENEVFEYLRIQLGFRDLSEVTTQIKCEASRKLKDFVDFCLDKKSLDNLSLSQQAELNLELIVIYAPYLKEHLDLAALSLFKSFAASSTNYKIAQFIGQALVSMDLNSEEANNLIAEIESIHDEIKEEHIKMHFKNLSYLYQAIAYADTVANDKLYTLRFTEKMESQQELSKGELKKLVLYLSSFPSNGVWYLLKNSQFWNREFLKLDHQNLLLLLQANSTIEEKFIITNSLINYIRKTPLTFSELIKLKLGVDALSPYSNNETSKIATESMLAELKDVIKKALRKVQIGH